VEFEVLYKVQDNKFGVDVCRYKNPDQKRAFLINEDVSKSNDSS